MKLKPPIPVLALLAALVLLPVLGPALCGIDLRRYGEFPPQTVYVDHASFSWTAFVLIAAAVLAVCAPFVLRILRQGRTGVGQGRGARGSFPRWGYFGLALLLLAWFIAWTRLDSFSSVQRFTFSPIWLGYILAVNAWLKRRSGDCLLCRRPAVIAVLFLGSALFWWYFEYLNRFVQNWVYSGVGDLSAGEYIIFATLPFSTVLPAVLSTEELLATFPRITSGVENFAPLDIFRRRASALWILALACIGLALVGVFPSQLFPLLWLAPIFVIAAVQRLCGRETIFSPLARGDWSRVCRLALAALICGFFWELWNYGSLARWEYRVPYVNRFHIFEMPLLGYAGYLPFGIECGMIADLLINNLTGGPARGRL